LSQVVFGKTFDNPVGVAAGFDKPADLSHLMHALGFGFSEVGAVTPLPQPGNPRPRLFRLPVDSAIINRMGFNNNGIDSLEKNIKKRPAGLVIGINIGKNKNTPNEDAVSDYVQSVNRLAKFADFFVINVSSPNTKNLRQLQDKEPLKKLLEATAAARPKGCDVPILLKLAPDLTEGQLDDVLEVSLSAGIDGLVATNTTISRSELTTSQHRLDQIGDGGLSGKPLKERSTAVVRYLYSHSSGKIPIIGVGGIASAEDAYEKVLAGASLVQVYTGLVYEGPRLIRRINQGLVKLLARDGYKNIAEAVGSKVQ